MNAYKKAVNKLKKAVNKPGFLTFKELFTAHYDTRTDLINGCRPYSFSWYHERRHQIQFRNDTVQKLHHYLTLGEITAIFLLVGGFIKAFQDLEIATTFWALASFLVLPYAAFILVIEIDAWIYSIKMIRKKKQE